MEKSLTAQEGWQRLSDSGKKLVTVLSLSGGSKARWFIERMFEEDSIDVDGTFEELEDLGILEVKSLIQEKRERLEELGGALPAEQAVMMSQCEVTDEVRERLRLQSDISAYDEDPSCHPTWDDPRYRVSEEMQDFIDALASSAAG